MCLLVQPSSLNVIIVVENRSVKTTAARITDKKKKMAGMFIIGITGYYEFCNDWVFSWV